MHVRSTAGPHSPPPLQSETSRHAGLCHTVAQGLTPQPAAVPWRAEGQWCISNDGTSFAGRISCVPNQGARRTASGGRTCCSYAP
jgi:hypothetical protein